MYKRLDIEKRKEEVLNLYSEDNSLTKISILMDCSRDVIKRILLENKIVIKSPKFYFKNRIAWNKGLTKETDERIKKYGEFHKKNHKEGKIKNWNKGLTKETDERVRKNAENIKFGYHNGRKTWCEGLTKEIDKRLMKMSLDSKGKHHSPKTEFIKHDLNNQIRKARKRVSPNKPEKIIINLIQQNNLNFIYVGDGKKFIKGKNYSFNPDFISKNQKYIIEVFGDYWHNLPKMIKRDKERLLTYSEQGYKTLVVWEHELRNQPQILNKIQKFVK